MSLKILDDGPFFKFIYHFMNPLHYFFSVSNAYKSSVAILVFQLKNNCVEYIF